MIPSPIADLSYRNYDGALENPRLRWWVIARTMMQIAAKKRAVWVCSALSSWYYLIIIAEMFIVEQIVSGTGGGEGAKQLIARLVWKDQFVHGFSFGQILTLIIALYIGAGTIANDNRSNALLVYLSRPVTKLDYVIGKWVGLFLPLFLVTAIPATIFYLYGALSFRAYGFVSDDVWMLPKVLLALGLNAAFQTSLVIGISSMFKQGRSAGATYAGLYFFSNFFTQMMVVAWINMSFSKGPTPFKDLVRNLYYSSLDGLTIGLMKLILKTDGSAQFGAPSKMPMVIRPDVWVIAVGMISLSAICIFIAWQRVRAVEVVG